MGGCLNTCCASEAGLRCHSVITLCGFGYFVPYNPLSCSCFSYSQSNSSISSSKFPTPRVRVGRVSSPLWYIHHNKVLSSLVFHRHDKPFEGGLEQKGCKG